MLAHREYAHVRFYVRSILDWISRNGAVRREADKTIIYVWKKEDRRKQRTAQHMVESHWLISNVFSFTPVCAQHSAQMCSRVHVWVLSSLPAFGNAIRLMLLAHHIDTVWLRVSEHWTRSWLVAYACPLAHAVLNVQKVQSERCVPTLNRTCSKMCILLIGFGSVLGYVRQFTELKRKTRQNELNGRLVLHKHFRDYVLYSLSSFETYSQVSNIRTEQGTKTWRKMKTQMLKRMKTI